MAEEEKPLMDDNSGTMSEKERNKQKAINRQKELRERFQKNENNVNDGDLPPEVTSAVRRAVCYNVCVNFILLGALIILAEWWRQTHD